MVTDPTHGSPPSPPHPLTPAAWPQAGDAGQKPLLLLPTLPLPSLLPPTPYSPAAVVLQHQERSHHLKACQLTARPTVLDVPLFPALPMLPDHPSPILLALSGSQRADVSFCVPRACHSAQDRARVPYKNVPITPGTEITRRTWVA